MDDELIDFFAGLAMLGLISSGKLKPTATEKEMSDQCYVLAEAMMQTRKERMVKTNENT
jgi:hypothetical protein